MDVCSFSECVAQETQKSSKNCKKTREYQFEMSKWEEAKLRGKTTFWEKARENRK